jgi:hypothetical protein
MSAPRLSVDALQAATRDGVAYLLRSIRDDGSFIYHQNAATGKILPGYNILRHAGSLCIIYQAIPLTAMSAADPLIEKACAFMMTYLHVLPPSLLPTGGGDIACIVEANEAKLGGTGLALLALIERYKVRPDPDSLLQMKRMAAFLVWMQEGSGKFRSKLIYDKGRFAFFESVYYPGEAILALLRLYAIDPDPRWLQTARTGSDYLVKNPVRSEVFDRGHHHWFAIALTELHAIVPRRRYYFEFWRIADSTFDSVRQNLWSISEPDFASKPFSSASMATRGETLVAGLTMEMRLRRTRRQAALSGILHELLTYCLSLQLTGDDIPPAYKGGIRVRKDSYMIRIDYVQHVLSVVMGLLGAF